MNLRVVGFVFRSIRASFRGEKLNHVLTITTVCVCLAVVGGVFLAQRNLVHWAETWAAERAIVVFVRGDADASTRNDLRERLARDAELTKLSWSTPAEAADDLARVLGLSENASLEQISPWILEGQRTQATREEALEEIAAHDAVLHLDQGTLAASKLRNLARSVRVGGAGLSLFLLLGAFLVVSNTVGLALNARREEVEIMDLVGTPLGWMYSAYIAEGVVLGATGAAAAIILLQLPLALGAGQWLEMFGMPPLRGFHARDIVALLMIGGLIGAFGSAISVRRFLRGEWE